MKKHLVSAIFFAFCSLGLQADCNTSSSCCSTSSSCSTRSSCSTNTSCSDSCKCIATGKSFFTIRPAFERVSPEFLTFFRDREDRVENGWQGAFQIVPLGGRSTKSDRLAQYFFPNCKQTLSVNEGTCGTGDPEQDIIAQHLGIHTVDENFESTITICPRHSFAGVGLSWKQSFYERCEGQDFWFLLSGPVLNVKNKVNLYENVINDGGGVSTDISVAVANATDAFKQDRWKFGKINDCCNNSKTGFGDLFVLVGYEFSEHDCCSLESYVGFIAPTSNKPNSEYVFEAIVGHNGNAAFTFGSSILMDIWEDCDRSLGFAFDMSGQVFFNKRQCRSLDLKCKPWSRYMLVFANEEAANNAAGEAVTDDTYFTNATPGINAFTQEVKVRQGFTRALNSAFVYNRCSWEFEAGYNFWAQNAECIKLACPFSSTIALATPCRTFDNNVANSVQEIGNIFDNFNVGTYEDNLIKSDDLDLRSAAHPCSQQQTIYGALGYNWDHDCYPSVIGFGGSYQFDEYNTALNQWMLWGKVAVSF